MLVATGLAIGSAVLHAGWNLFVKGHTDRLVAAWGTLAATSVLAIPVVVLVGTPHDRVWPYLATSVALHVAYTLALVRAYQDAPLSVAYPIARGLAPLLTAVGGGVFLSDGLTGPGYAGAAVATGGLLWIGLSARSDYDLRAAVGTGAIITAYTLVDTAGVRAGGGALEYVTTMLALTAAVVTVPVLLRRPAATLVATLRTDWARLTGSGLATVAAYAMVLAAVQRAPVGYVATLRETSIVFGALGGWLLLGEGLGRRRLMGSAAIVAGVALLAASVP